MTNNGQITCQIKDKRLRKAFLDTVEKLPVSQSEFVRISIRHMIACVQATGHLPPVKIEE